MNLDDAHRRILAANGKDTSTMTPGQFRAGRLATIPDYVDKFRPQPAPYAERVTGLTHEAPDMTPSPEPTPLILSQHRAAPAEPTQFWHLFGGFDGDLWATALIGPSPDPGTLTGTPLNEVELPFGDDGSKMTWIVTFDHSPAATELDTYAPDGYASTDGQDIYGAVGVIDPDTGTLHRAGRGDTPTHLQLTSAEQRPVP